jgi:transposase
VRNVRLWRALLGVDQRTVIEDIEFEEFAEEDADGDTLVVAQVRPRSGVSRRCGRCGRKAPWYDRARVGAGGGAWIGAQCRWYWRPMRHG